MYTKCLICKVDSNCLTNASIKITVMSIQSKEKQRNYRMSPLGGPLEMLLPRSCSRVEGGMYTQKGAGCDAVRSRGVCGKKEIICL